MLTVTRRYLTPFLSIFLLISCVAPDAAVERAEPEPTPIQEEVEQEVEEFMDRRERRVTSTLTSGSEGDGPPSMAVAASDPEFNIYFEPVHHTMAEVGFGTLSNLCDLSEDQKSLFELSVEAIRSGAPVRVPQSTVRGLVIELLIVADECPAARDMIHGTLISGINSNLMQIALGNL